MKAENNTRKAKFIFLTGMRGAGKSSLGKALALRHALPFCDLDQLISKKSGASIAEIVAKKGWPYFRVAEKEALREICAKTLNTRPVILATGGGAVLDAENRQFMREMGTVFWLKAEPQILAHRLSLEPLPEQRPAFGKASLLEELALTLAEREALYHESADYILNAALPLPDLLTEIERQLGL